MATKPLLADLVALYKAQAPHVQVQVESVGGVDAAKRVQAGEAFDGVVLASYAIDKLIASCHLRAGSWVDLVHSGVAVAVPAGPSALDISSEDALRQAVLAAPSVGLSTGPSGVQLRQLFALGHPPADRVEAGASPARRASGRPAGPGRSGVGFSATERNARGGRHHGPGPHAPGGADHHHLFRQRGHQLRTA